MEEASGSGSGSSYGVQRIFVMRHGEREDSRNPLWKRTAVRPYDTPITKRGEAEARRKWQGKKRTELSVRHIAIIVLLQMWPETRNDFPCPVFLVHGNEAASHDAS